MDWITIVFLVISGLLVGFINTLAGGGTIISLSLLILLGLPPAMANGTNRLAVLFQVITSTAGFRRHRVLDIGEGTWLGIPTIIGSVIGSFIAIDINERVFELALSIAMIMMLFFIFIKPAAWIKGNPSYKGKRARTVPFLVFFLVGLYGGFIHVGVGYLILAAVVLGAGYDLLRANALKVYIVLLYIPFSLAVFMISGQVNYRYGLIHALGNIAGAWIATRSAVSWGVSFVKWVLVVVVLFFAANTFGLIDIRSMIGKLVE